MEIVTTKMRYQINTNRYVYMSLLLGLVLSSARSNAETSPKKSNNFVTAESALGAVDSVGKDASERPSTPRSVGSDKVPNFSPPVPLATDTGPIGDETSGPGNPNRITITNSHNPRRGMNVNTEMPSVRYVSMAPASAGYGGDDVEIVVSPLFDVVIQMPEDISYFRSSSQIVKISKIENFPNMVALKFAGEAEPRPASVHLIDTQGEIYTFTIIGIGTTVDLSWEYPKTIIVKRKRVKKTKIGPDNPRSITDAMEAEDAINLVVGLRPRTDEFLVELVGATYMHYKGYGMYSFRVSRKDAADFKSSDLKMTIWANDQRIDGGKKYSSSKKVHWIFDEKLSHLESQITGLQVLRVFVQVSASIIDLEEWQNSFLTVADKNSYSRFDFKPLMRNFRAPPNAMTE